MAHLAALKNQIIIDMTRLALLEWRISAYFNYVHSMPNSQQCGDGKP